MKLFCIGIFFPTKLKKRVTVQTLKSLKGNKSKSMHILKNSCPELSKNTSVMTLTFLSFRKQLQKDKREL